MLSIGSWPLISDRPNQIPRRRKSDTFALYHRTQLNSRRPTALRSVTNGSSKAAKRDSKESSNKADKANKAPRETRAVRTASSSKMSRANKRVTKASFQTTNNRIRAKAASRAAAASPLQRTGRMTENRMAKATLNKTARTRESTLRLAPSKRTDKARRT